MVKILDYRPYATEANNYSNSKPPLWHEQCTFRCEIGAININSRFEEILLYPKVKQVLTSYPDTKAIVILRRPYGKLELRAYREA